MKTIPSFTIDHIHLLRGIYVSRKITIDGEVPFKEMEDYGFTYESNWRTDVLSDEEGNPYRQTLNINLGTIGSFKDTITQS